MAIRTQSFPRTLPAASLLREAQMKRASEMTAWKGEAPTPRTVENLTFTVWGGRVMWDGPALGRKSEFVSKFTELPRLEDFSSEPEALQKQLSRATFIGAEILRTCIRWDMERTPLELGCKSEGVMAIQAEADLIANALRHRFVDEFLFALEYNAQGLCEFTCAQVVEWVDEASADLTSADFQAADFPAATDAAKQGNEGSHRANSASEGAARTRPFHPLQQLEKVAA